MTLDDGSLLDSRQPIDGDPDSEITGRSLAASWLWWDAASSLVLPILEAEGQDAFALVLGQRSIVDLRSNGEIRRTRLSRLLRGGVGRITVLRTSMNEQLPSGYDEVITLRGWNGESLGIVGVRAEPSEGRWRFIDGPDYLRYTAGHIRSKVLVSTGQWVFSREPVKRLGSERFEVLETEYLGSEGAMLVIPHTRSTDVFMRKYVAWVKKGRPVSETSYRNDTPPWDPATPPDPVHYAHPIPVEANFHVTGLIQDGDWQNPSDLEAARSLLHTRFDLRIGIWDLVNNPVLRRTLLKRPPVVRTPGRGAAIPSGATERASATVAAKLNQRALIEAARLELAPLKSVGWRDARYPYEQLHFPMTEPLQLWPGDSKSEPLIWLTLGILKRQTQVSVWSGMHAEVDLVAHVADRRTELEAIARSNFGSLDKGWPMLWRGRGGWADEVDWTTRALELSALTLDWVELFEDLVAACRRVIANRDLGQ